jgi:hypothetical protein
MATSVEQICNQALRRVGNETPIGSIYEGSRASRIALDLYGATRDELLKSQDWDFAERLVTLTASSVSAPAGWPYVYTYPADCLKVRYVQPSTIPSPNLDPVATLFTDLNVNASGTQTRVIVANISPAVLCYTGQITDMTTWDAGFNEALVEELGRRFAEAFGMPEDSVVNRTSLAQRADGDLANAQSRTPPNPMRVLGMPEPAGRRG